jgi:hypothetical protein
MKVLIVGLNHQIQRSEVLRGGAEIEQLEREQTRYKSRHKCRVREHSPRLSNWENWWTWSGSNRRPLPCHGSALPAAPQAHERQAY